MTIRSLTFQLLHTSNYTEFVKHAYTYLIVCWHFHENFPGDLLVSCEQFYFTLLLPYELWPLNSYIPLTILNASEHAYAYLIHLQYWSFIASILWRLPRWLACFLWKFLFHTSMTIWSLTFELLHTTDSTDFILTWLCIHLQYWTLIAVQKKVRWTDRRPQ